MTKDPLLAQDLTSTTFERALAAWSRFDPRRASALTWLCQLARTATLDHFRAEERRRRREERYAREQPTVGAEPSGGTPFSPVLERALATLSAADREVI